MGRERHPDVGPMQSRNERGPSRTSRRARRLFPMQDRIAYQGITFDDVLLEPGYSELLPRQVDTRTQLTAKIALNIPILSSPMDTVTEAELAIALAQEGGLGRHPQEHVDRGADPRGRQGQAVGERDHRRPDHPAARRHRRPGPRDHARAQHLGRADHRQRQAPGHPHPPRPPVPGVERPPDRGGHDQGQPGHRPGRHQPGGGRSDFDEK